MSIFVPPRKVSGLNIPSLVDNLWEWPRPINYPSFREMELADLTEHQMETLMGKGGAPATLLRYNQGFMAIPATPLLAHPDIAGPRCLEQRLCRLLGESWIGQPPLRKTTESLLWAPGLTCDDVEEIIHASTILTLHRRELWDSITVWGRCTLFTG